MEAIPSLKVNGNFIFLGLKHYLSSKNFCVSLLSKLRLWLESLDVGYRSAGKILHLVILSRIAELWLLSQCYWDCLEEY